MHISTFLVLNAALALGCGGSDYSDYFIPTGATRSTTTSSSTNGTDGTSDSASTGTGGASTSGAGGSSSSGTGSGGTGASAGSGGSGSIADAGGSGCHGASAWMMGWPYMAGASVKAVCMNPGGGSTMCDVGKTYLWTCKEGAVCALYAPGADGWWGAWTVGMRCDG